MINKVPTISVPAEQKAIIRYYSDFCGVDFRTPHTQVSPDHSPFCINMFKDSSAEKDGIKTRPGLTKSANFFPCVSMAYAPSSLFGKTFITEFRNQVIVRMGSYLIRWSSFPSDPFKVLGHQTNIVSCSEYTVLSSALSCADTKNIEFDTCFAIFDNILYVYDIKGVLIYDGEKTTMNLCDGTLLNPSSITDFAELPSWKAPITIINCDSNGKGDVYQPYNLISPYYIVKYIAPGDTLSFLLPVKNSRAVSIQISGSNATSNPSGIALSTGISTTTAFSKGTEFSLLCSRSTENDNYYVNRSSVVGQMTLCTVFDNRVFLAGNASEKYKNRLIHSIAAEPLYFPDNSYYEDIRGEGKISAILPTDNCLAVIKEDVFGKNAIYMHCPTATTIDIAPKIYPSISGLYDVGCVNKYSAINFNNQTVFLSKTGVKTILKSNNSDSRTIAHLSSSIDSILLSCNLKNASVTSWKNYFVILVDDKIFLGNANKKYYNKDTDSVEYEWYYWQNITTDAITAKKLYTLHESDGETEILFFVDKNRAMYRFDENKTSDDSIPIFSCFATISDLYNAPNRVKTTNKRGGVAHVYGENVNMCIKTSMTPYGKVIANPQYISGSTLNRFKFSDNTLIQIQKLKRTTDRLTYKIKEKKWTHLSMIFYSEKPFTIYDATLEAYIKGYTK